MVGFRFDDETHCRHGHDLRLPDAIYVHTGSGLRTCRECLLRRNKVRNSNRILRLAAEGRCAKGHTLSPENMVRSARKGDARLTCRICQESRILYNQKGGKGKLRTPMPSEECGEEATMFIILQLDEQLDRASTSWERAEIKARIAEARERYDNYTRTVLARLQGK